MLVSELEDYAVSYANGVSRHASVVLGVPRRRYAGHASSAAPDVDLRLMDWPRHRSPASAAFVLGLARNVRRERPSLVHFLSHTNLWLNLAPYLWGDIPLVTTVHDVSKHPGDRDTGTVPGWASRWSVRQSDDIVVHGDGLRRAAIAAFGKPADRVHALPHPAIPRYAELARERRLFRREDGAFSVLMFGRMFAYKGLEHLIRAEAMARPQTPALRVTIAGRGDDPWAFRELMGDPARYDIRRRFIEDEETAQLFLDADVVALPYVEASQSGVLNIAATFGRPVVATDVGELRATVEGAGMGLVVPPGDPAALARAIARLAADPALAAALGANAKAWADGVNAPESVGALATGLYGSILRRMDCRRVGAPEPA